LQVEDGYTLSGGVPGYGSFRTSDDQWIALGVIAEEHLWTALVTALELTELVSLRFLERVQRTDELNGLIATQIGKLDRTTAVDKLSNAGVPVSPVLGQRELADNPHLLARGVVRRDIAGQPAMGHPVTYTQHPAVDPGEVPSLARGPAARPQWQHRA
jgi:crotonobetainyl-CoA:carnitine CoA-transferase CaiB-like acyl-CoA transferase